MDGAAAARDNRRTANGRFPAGISGASPTGVGRSRPLSDGSLAVLRRCPGLSPKPPERAPESDRQESA